MKRALIAVGLVVTFAAVCSAQSFTYYFPHVTTGVYDGGSWQTTIFLTYASSAGGPATGTVSFTRSDGTPMNITFVDEMNQLAASGSSISFTLSPGETRKYI